jgi:hypothetical protein
MVVVTGDQVQGLQPVEDLAGMAATAVVQADTLVMVVMVILQA